MRKACTLLNPNELVRDNQFCEKLINWEQFWHRSYLGVCSFHTWALAGLLMNAASWHTMKRSFRNFAPEVSCRAASKWGYTPFLNCSQGPLKSHNFRVFWQGGHTKAHERRLAWGKEGTVPGKLIIHCSGHLSQKKWKRAEKSAERCWPDGYVWAARNRSFMHWSMGLSSIFVKRQFGTWAKPVSIQIKVRASEWNPFSEDDFMFNP